MNTTSEIKRILSKKYKQVAPRGLKVNEYIQESIEIDPLNAISNFESRPFNFKYFTGEMLWYLCGNFKVDFISKFSKFWLNIADQNNQINSNYGQIILKQFKFAYDSLAQDKYTRQAVMTINESRHQKPTKDFPCTLNLLFFIRDDKLNMRVQMRSQDIFYGLQYDVPWYSFVHQNMYLLLKKVYPKLELGTYVHYMDNVHYYERHFELVNKIKKEKSTTFYRFRLLKPIILVKKDKAVVHRDFVAQFQAFKNDLVDIKSLNFFEYLNSLGFIKIEKFTQVTKLGILTKFKLMLNSVFKLK